MELGEHGVRLIVQDPVLHRLGIEGFAVGEGQTGSKGQCETVSPDSPRRGESRFYLVLGVPCQQEPIDLFGHQGVTFALALCRVESVRELRGEVVADVQGIPGRCRGLARQPGHGRREPPGQGDQRDDGKTATLQSERPRRCCGTFRDHFQTITSELVNYWFTYRRRGMSARRHLLAESRSCSYRFGYGACN